MKKLNLSQNNLTPKKLTHPYTLIVHHDVEILEKNF